MANNKMSVAPRASSLSIIADDSVFFTNEDTDTAVRTYNIRDRVSKVPQNMSLTRQTKNVSTTPTCATVQRCNGGRTFSWCDLNSHHKVDCYCRIYPRLAQDTLALAVCTSFQCLVTYTLNTLSYSRVSLTTYL